MTAMDLLEVIGSIRNSYVLESKKVSEEKETKNLNPSNGQLIEESLPFQTEKGSRYYQANRSKKRKKNGLKRFLALSAAAGLLLAVLAGRGTIAGWADYFKTFLNRTENPYQYTQPVDTTEPSQEETETMIAENGVFYICADGTFIPVSRIAEGTQLLTGSMILSSAAVENAVQNAPLAEALNQTETPAGSGLGPVASDGTWNFFPDDVQYNTYTPENQPNRGEWTAFFAERLQAMGLDAPVLIQNAASFQSNGREIALVTASNVRATEAGNLLEAEEIAQTDRPGNAEPGVYVITALFVEGEEATELYSQYSEISSSMGADYLPWSQDGSYMQPLSAMQFGSDGSVAEFPIFTDMSGEMALRILGVYPAFLVADIDGDGISEMILCLTGVSSDMSWCKVYSFRSDSLEEMLHLALN